MPKRSSDHNQSHPTLLRRSPRFLHHGDPEKFEDHNTYKLKLRKCQVRSPYAVLALAAQPVQNPPIPKTPNVNPDRISKKCSKSRKDLNKRFDEVGGLRRSPRLNNGVDGFTGHAQSSNFCSSRFVEEANADKVKNVIESGFSRTAAIPTTPNPDPDKISRKSSKFGNDLVKPAAGLGRSPILNNGVDKFSRRKQSSKSYSGEILDISVVNKARKKKNKSEHKTAGTKREKGAVEVEKEKGTVVAVVDKVKKKKKKSKPEDKTTGSNGEKGAMAVEKEKELVVVVDKVKNEKKSKRLGKTASSNRQKGAVAVEKEKEHVDEKERKRKRNRSGSLHGHSNKILTADLGENKIPFAADRSEKRFIETEVNGGKGEMCEMSGEENANVSERLICIGLKALSSEGDGEGRVSSAGNVEIRVKRMRKPCMASNGVVQGWTKEQEAALQRAYYASKPTPHFWKNVAKLVPGKSAQECFDNINSDHVTPPQVRIRSRAKKISSVSIEQFSLSASKLLEPNEAKSKRSRQRAHGGWKSIRKLLQKNCLVDGDNGADLFSILEPNVDLSANALPNISPMISTPVHQIAADGFLMKCQEGYSGQKGHKSKLSSSSMTPILSPPVLKPVKNRILHEKYVDQLHSRDARRKVESRRGKSCSGKENHRTLPMENVDGVKVATSYLVAKARDAINELKHLHEDSAINSDLEDDEVEVGDADGDLEL